jgi:DNA-binding MarR family transcriptional regulator
MAIKAYASDLPLDIADQLQQSAWRLLRVLRTVRSTEGLSTSKLGVLGCLRRDGLATAAELASYLHVQPQSLTRMIEDLERRCLITRRTNTEDRRQSLLEITDAGTQILSETVCEQRAFLAQAIMNVLTHPEQELIRLSAELMNKLATATEALIVAPDAKK